MPEIPLAKWVDSAVNWMTKHWDPFFSFIKTIINSVVGHLSDWLAAPPMIVMAILIAVLCWWLRGLAAGVLTFAGLLLIDSLGQWENTMISLALVLVSAVVALAIAIPTGVAAARRPRFAAVIRPVLDFMQTMPAFVYLVPAVTFFAVGVTPGVIATLIFSLPPGVRMTQHGIQQVDTEMVEAAEAFGTPPRRVLTGVQLPLALPTIMTGVNQVIMLSLSMVVIAGMVGAPGLGQEVYAAISNAQTGEGVVSGLAVVIMAIILDRMTGALGQRFAPAARRRAEQNAAGEGASAVLSWRPQRALAFPAVGVLAILAIVTGAINVNDGGSGGKGKPITIGYINWDEDVAATFLWKRALEDKGYKVNLQQVDPGPLFAGLGGGNVDLFLDAWLPVTHAQYYNKYKSDLERLGYWYDKTSMQLAVLKDDPANSVEDLMKDPDRYKKQITGIEPGAGETKIINDKVMPDYGLKDGGWKHVTSSTATMLASINRATQTKQPVVVALWKPHWAYTKYPIKPLADPKGAFGANEKLDMLGRKGFKKDFPEVTKWLSKFSMTDQQLFPLEDLVMNKYKGNEEKGVDEWVKANPDYLKKITG
ncbi:ABC transporter permease/substrate binding protein [Actinomadura barringtoniae]|uniref:ABC transporter permease/substrate binding protein n=1 Tax=Actinomadura barringtoniae TaxID=1427535 RepID=A0A939PB25_9ACTN|nr:ABC transporter permease/substrate binding protein [Actinomadura barringtoniae]MBO2449143.1 ABC transporter permease/substrate binding protein [Actinomadura barringtoniae]